MEHAGFSPERRVLAVGAILLAAALASLPGACVAQSGETQGAEPGAGRRSLQQAVGTVKAISDTGIILTSDSSEEVHVVLQDSTHIFRIAPGQKDMKSATPLQKSDIQMGDRVLVRGKPGTEAHALNAFVIVVMKQEDVAAKQQREREDWQKRGVGGLVTAVDAATGTITISMTSFTGSKSIAVHTTKNTILRRYAPDSVKFDEAKIAPLEQIKVGDQLRARGNKNENGTELAAEEVVSGTFRNLAGTITAVDAAANTLTLKDLISKQSVVVRVTGEAQLRKLPAEFAQRIAIRLKAGAAAGIPGAAAVAGGGATGGGAGGTNAGSRPQGGSGQFPGGPPGGMGPGARAGPPDIQQILSRMPAANLADLQKGDAVMIVSTQGNGSEVHAITLLAGVEPLLTAAPSASQALMLSPWSLSSSSAETAAQ